MFKVKQLQLDITHACNFQCDGCAHYSNFAIKGAVPFTAGSEWLTDWSKRVTPEIFTVLGGEPTLHPELIQYVELIPKLWPTSARRLFTNGYFLDRHPQLPEVLARTKTQLNITVHFDDDEYHEKLIPLMRRWSRMSKEYGFSLNIPDARHFWYKAYQGAGKDMLPFNDGNPRASWNVCISKWCMQLHQGRLWKCPNLAYLGTISEKFRLHEKAEWQPYLGYAGLGLDASDKELHDFLAREEESACAMCPSAMPAMISHGKSPEALAAASRLRVAN